MVQARTPLEEEVAAVLRGSAHVLERSNKELTEEEEKALLAMDLEEVQLLLLELYVMNLMFSTENGQIETNHLKALLFSFLLLTHWFNSLRTKKLKYLSMLM